MRRDLSKRRAWRFGLWLGLLALVIQGIFPFLLAAELRAASLDEDRAGFCRIEAGAHQADGQPGQGHDHVRCPICPGLQAGTGFPLPDAPSLSPPVSSGKATLVGTETAFVSASLALAYRSRAPPLQG